MRESRVRVPPPTPVISRNPQPSEHFSSDCSLLAPVEALRWYSPRGRSEQGTLSLFQDNTRQNNRSARDSLFFRDPSFLPSCDSMCWQWQILCSRRHFLATPSYTVIARKFHRHLRSRGRSGGYHQKA